VKIELHDQHRGLGYRDSQGWVPVQECSLGLYSPKLDQLFDQLLGKNLRPLPSGCDKIDGRGFIWGIGSVRLLKHSRSPVWFARRLGDRVIADVLVEENAARPSPEMRLVLTSTPRERIAQSGVPRLSIISIADVLSGANPIRIDFGILKARFQGQPAEDIEYPLHLSADNRMLIINGKVRIDLRGDKQGLVARLIVDAYKRGRPIKAAQILGQADSSAGSFDQAFGRKPWDKLKLYFKSQGGGRWGFEF
jgi:hypothetical protein